MIEIWQKNIHTNHTAVQASRGPALVTVVSGSEIDRAYWAERFTAVRRDIFRQDGETQIISVCEGTRKGNFLGTLNAWAETKRSARALPPLALMSMVFGKGKRFSPFTQAMGNRKPAFITPRRLSHANLYATTADVSNLYANLWLKHLEKGGFRGVVVKWGDEAIIPGVDWNAAPQDFSRVDAVRFVWKTEITENLAREKDWVAIDARTNLMTFQFSRQEEHLLRQRIASLPTDDIVVGVNLGSLAVSGDFLDIALDVFSADVLAKDKWNDWDPYTWIALSCRDQAQWQAEIDHELSLGKTGLRDLVARYPDFFDKLIQVRTRLEARTGRPLAVGILDFGEAFWVDLGLHITLRASMDSMTTDSERGQATRELFGIPHERDANGNIIVDSQLPPGMKVRDSIIVDTIITDPSSLIQRGVVIGGRHKKVMMPDGGSALFCTADTLTFTGANGVAFRAIAKSISLPEGGRFTTLFLPDGIESMVSSESVIDYNGRNYDEPILGNRISFEQAGDLSEQVDSWQMEAQWQAARQAWIQAHLPNA